MSTHVKFDLSAAHVVHSFTSNDVPFDRLTHHCPVAWKRPKMSVRPSPLTSPTATSAQLTADDHWEKTVPGLDVVPFEVATHQPPSALLPAPWDAATHTWPVDATRPTIEFTGTTLESSYAPMSTWLPKMRDSPRWSERLEMNLTSPRPTRSPPAAPVKPKKLSVMVTCTALA